MVLKVSRFSHIAHPKIMDGDELRPISGLRQQEHAKADIHFILSWILLTKLQSKQEGKRVKVYGSNLHFGISQGYPYYPSS